MFHVLYSFPCTADNVEVMTQDTQNTHWPWQTVRACVFYPKPRPVSFIGDKEPWNFLSYFWNTTLPCLTSATCQPRDSLFSSPYVSQQAGSFPERLSSNLTDVLRVCRVTAIEHDAHPAHKRWLREHNQYDQSQKNAVKCAKPCVIYDMKLHKCEHVCLYILY